ncbi:hypothetical protein ACFIOY_09960 [Bradyrhizobium sp. TZ2]
MLAVIAAAPEFATPDDQMVRSGWRFADDLHKRTAIRAQSATIFAMHHD